MKNTSNKLLLIFLVTIQLLACKTAIGQQLPFLNHDKGVYNPSIINANYFKNYLPSTIKVQYRHQWTDLQDAPRTLNGTFTSWNEDYNLLFGARLVSDQTGPTGFNGVFGKVGYGVELSSDFLWTVGVSAGVRQFRVKGNELNFLEPGDIAGENESRFYPDVTLGTTVYFKERYYLGLSVPQIIGLDLKFKDATNDFKIKRVQHYHGVLGALFELDSDSWVEFSSEFRYVQNAPLHFNGQFKYEYQQMLWVGGGMTSSKELSGNIGVIVDFGANSNLLRIGYSFSNFLQTYGPVFGNAHEIGIEVSL